MPFILCCCQWWARTIKKETGLPKRRLFNNSNNIGLVAVCWMYCLWQKRLSCVASPYHFQYSSFAGYWKVAKHSGFYPLFYFLYFGIKVAFFLIFRFVLLDYIWMHSKQAYIASCPVQVLLLVSPLVFDGLCVQHPLHTPDPNSDILLLLQCFLLGGTFSPRPDLSKNSLTDSSTSSCWPDFSVRKIISFSRTANGLWNQLSDRL